MIVYTFNLNLQTWAICDSATPHYIILWIWIATLITNKTLVNNTDKIILNLTVSTPCTGILLFSYHKQLYQLTMVRLSLWSSLTGLLHWDHQLLTFQSFVVIMLIVIMWTWSLRHIHFIWTLRRTVKIIPFKHIAFSVMTHKLGILFRIFLRGNLSLTGI